MANDGKTAGPQTGTLGPQAVTATELGANFSSPVEKESFVKSRADGYVQEGKTKEEAMRLADRDWDKHNTTVVVPGLIRNALADATKGLPEDQRSHMKKTAEELINLLKAGGMADIENQKAALNDWRNDFRGHQNTMISRAIDAGTAPFDAMQGLSRLGVFFGGIAAFLGKAMGNPEWEKFGNDALAASLKMSKVAKEGILTQKSEMANQVVMAPDKWNTNVIDKTDYMRGKARSLLNEIGKDINDPAFIKRLEGLVESAYAGRQPSDGSGSTTRTYEGHNGFSVKPYSAKNVADRARAIKSPSKFDPLFSAAETLYGLPAGDLKTVAVVESGLNPNAEGPMTKHGKAKGLMQFIDSTARENGVTNAKDPVQAIFGAARYRANLYAQHGTSDKVDAHYYGVGTEDTKTYVENMKSLRKAVSGNEVSKPSKLNLVSKDQADLSMNESAESFYHTKEIAAAAIDKAKKSSHAELAQKAKNDYKVASANTGAPKGSTGERGMKQGAEMHAHAPETTQKPGGQEWKGKITIAPTIDPRKLPAPALTPS